MARRSLGATLYIFNGSSLLIFYSREVVYIRLIGVIAMLYVTNVATEKKRNKKIK